MFFVVDLRTPSSLTWLICVNCERRGGGEEEAVRMEAMRMEAVRRRGGREVQARPLELRATNEDLPT